MIIDLIIQAITYLIFVINSLGYFGIFVGMVLGSSFFPFSSEIILIPAGVLVSKGNMSFYLVLFFGIIGSLTGAFINFFLALSLGRKTIDKTISKYGRFLFISQEKLDKADNFFKEKGEITILTGMLIPVIRQIISIPAGFSKMNLAKFSLFTFLGAGMWCSLLIYAGYLAGNNSFWLEQNASWISIIFALLILIFLTIKIIFNTHKTNNKKNNHKK